MNTLNPNDWEVVPPSTSTPAVPIPAAGGMRVLDPSEWEAVAQPGQGESAARGALQGATLGFGDELAAGIDTAVSQIPGVRSLAQHFQAGDLPTLDNPDMTYQQRREAYRQKNQLAQQANPLTYGAGELAGGFAAPVPGSIGKGLLGAVKGGVVAGGLGALGSSNADLTQGEFGQAGRDILHGAGIGGALGGTLHAIGSKIGGGAEDRMVSDVVTDTAGRARPKDQLQIRRNVLADKGNADISGRDVVMADSTRPIVEAARAGKTQEALAEIEPRVNALEKAKAAPYKTVDTVTGGASVPEVVKAIDQRIGELAKATGTQAERRILTAVKNDVETTFGPEARIPTMKLRETVTSAQRSAIEALGTIAETEHARLASEGKNVLEKALDAHLTAAAEQGPGARAAVQQIRNINKEQSVLLSFKTGLQQKAAKELLQKQTLSQMAAGGVGHLAHLGGVGALLAGHPAGLAALAAPVAMKVAARGARLGNDTLARLLYQAGRGDARALGILHVIQHTPAVAAGLAGQASAP